MNSSFLSKSLLIVVLVFPLLAAAEKVDIPIGVIVPLTGGQATRGDDVARLIKILEPQINARSSQYRFRFIIDDGKCGSGNSSTTAAKKFISVDRVQFLITGCSGETLQVAPIAQRNKVLTIAVLSNHKDIKKLGPYVFRTFIDIEENLKQFASYIDSHAQGRVAVLTEENAYTFGIRDILLDHFGDTVVFADDFPPDTSDFNSLLTKTAHRKPAAIYFNALSEVSLAVLVNQAKALGLKQKLFSYSVPEVPAFLVATGINSEGLEFIGTPEIPNASKEFEDVFAQFHAVNPNGANYEFILRTFFDAAKSIVDGVHAVGPDATKVKDYLMDYRSVGALGPLSYDENGDVRDMNWFLWRIERGQLVSLGDMSNIDTDVVAIRTEQ